MEKLMMLLKEVRPDLDFKKEKSLIDDGILDSVDVMSIVVRLKEIFGVEISLAELDPDDFNSAETIINLVDRKKG